MPTRTSLLIALLLALVAFTGALAQEPPMGELFSPEAPVDITADSITYYKASNTYVATGSVEITQESTRLFSDSAILDMAAGVATATGGVRLIDEGGSTLSGESLQFNIRDKTAVLANGRIFYREDNVHITADAMTKTGPQSYEGESVVYTTCDCPPEQEPAWSFAATSAKVTVGQFLTGWNARFRVKGVPVLYSPFFSIPVKRQRQTGFLQPRPGYSRLRGLIIDNAFFWAISRSQDATFYLDIETIRGVGKGLEYRYARTARSSGALYLYHFQEDSIERVRQFRQGVNNLSRPAEATDSRWRLNFQHSEVLSGGVHIRANINLVSDDEYFIDFGKAAEERSLEALESNLSVSKNWSSYSLVGQMRLFDNLLDAEDKGTLQRLPEITLTGTDQRVLDSAFYFSSQSSLVNFWREEGAAGQRLDVRPRLSLPMSPGGYFDFTPSIGPRATFWAIDDDTGDRYSDRFTYDISANLTTTFVRVFRPDLDSLKALRHTIRPTVSYTYSPEAVQDDLPNFDGVDRIAPASSVTYSLNSTVTGKFQDSPEAEAAYFDYLYLDLSQTYNFYEAGRKLTSPTDERRPFSEITGELIARPASNVTLTGKGKFNVYENRSDSYDISLSASSKRGHSLSAAHRFVRDEANYLEAFVRARVTRAVDLTYLKRFSFDEDSDLETSYGIEYRHQCWSAALSYTDRLEERIVYLTFNLLGLGKVAGVQGRIEQQ